MRERSLRKYYDKRYPKDTENAVKAVKDWEKKLAKSGKTIKTSKTEDLNLHIADLVESGDNTEVSLLALARYFYLVKRNDLYHRMTAILGGRGVYASISDRLGEVAGPEKQSKVFEGFHQPPLGSDPEKYPVCTQDLLLRLNDSLDKTQMRRVLAGNHHRIPMQTFQEKKKRYEESKSLEEFLAGEHRLLVEELEETMKSGRLWYEQEITPNVVEFVRNDPRIQTGIVQGDQVIKTKIPYHPKQWLVEKDPMLKRYYACHCQLARSSILNGNSKELSEFCYCSAGYEKTPLEAVLGIPLEVKVLKSVLAGDDVCMFSISIPKESINKPKAN